MAAPTGHPPARSRDGRANSPENRCPPFAFPNPPGCSLRHPRFFLIDFGWQLYVFFAFGFSPPRNGSENGGVSVPLSLSQLPQKTGGDLPVKRLRRSRAPSFLCWIAIAGSVALAPAQARSSSPTVPPAFRRRLCLMVALVVSLGLIGVSISSASVVSSTVPTVNAAGTAELLGTVTLDCTGTRGDSSNVEPRATTNSFIPMANPMRW